MTITLRSVLEWFGILAVAILLWMNMRHPSIPVGVTVSATKAPEIAKSAKIEITPAKVQVYPQKVKLAMALPETVKADKAIAVLDSSKLPMNLHPQTITTTLNTTTGETATVVTVDPYPWLAAENRREFRVDYGIRYDGRAVARMSFTDDLIQIKAIHLGAKADLDSDGRFFIGVGAAYLF
jgi:hypothetical protein